MTTEARRTAVVTGGSQGLGLALGAALVREGWHVITDARDATRLREATEYSGAHGIAGDITDPRHREHLRDAVHEAGGLDLLVHNASTLGPLPMRPLTWLDAAALHQVVEVNAAGPLALTQTLHDDLVARHGMVITLSSDAAVEHYETWGAYGATKAMLDHLVLTYGAETGLTTYAVDPGDLRTAMHQDAFPGEDISDRPLPESVVPAFLRLIEDRPPSGRYRASELAVIGAS